MIQHACIMSVQLNQSPLTAEQLAQRLRMAALLKTVMATIGKKPSTAPQGSLKS